MKTRRIRRWLFRTALVAGLVAAVVIAVSPRPVKVDLETVSRGNLRVTLDHEGKTRIRDRYMISAPLAGRVHRIELEPGDPVKARETVLVTFEPRIPEFLDSRTRAEASARVKAAESARQRAEAEYRKAKAESELAKTQLVRVEQLVKQGITARSELDLAKGVESARRETVDAADAARNATGFELEAARARLVEPATDRTADQGGGRKVIALRSPINGVVLRRLRESEAVVPEGEPLLEVGASSNLEIVADFLSGDAVKVRPGMKVLIDRWGGEGMLGGRVRLVEPSGFMKISALGVEEQRVNVIIDFDDPRGAWKTLGAEYRVEVRIVIWEAPEVVLVPMTCLFPHQDGWGAFVLEGDVAKLRPVKVGRRTGVSAEVLGGLREGDRVVAYPSDDVVNGVRVEQREASRSRR